MKKILITDQISYYIISSILCYHGKQESDQHGKAAYQPLYHNIYIIALI